MSIKTIIQRIGKVSITSDPNSFDWRDTLIDAFIMAMVTFFTRLATTSDYSNQFWINATAQALLTFFTFIAIKRGLMKKGEGE
jgi:uncharacterized membrane protein YjjP (DUF1212 family)